MFKSKGIFPAADHRIMPTDLNSTVLAAHTIFLQMLLVIVHIYFILIPTRRKVKSNQIISLSNETLSKAGQRVRLVRAARRLRHDFRYEMKR